jgi:outer membrane protein insertion porin family
MPLLVTKLEKEDSEKQVNKYIRNISIALLLILPLLTKAQISPKVYTIENISVKGVTHLSPKTIISVSGLKIGDEISIPGTELSNAVKNIWSENIVGNVSIKVSEINGDLISLIIELTEHKRLSEVKITGVSKRQQKDLKESFDLVKSQILSEPLKKNLKIKIENFYKEKGFYNIKVSTPQISEDTSIANHNFITYHVERGAKLRINEIIIKGNNAVSEKFIERKMKKTKEKRIWRFWSRSKFLKDEYNLDEQKIVDYYNSIGMRDMTIELDSVYNVDDKNLNLALDIKEGNVYYFGDITWVGNSKYTDKQLNQILNIKKGDVFNRSNLDSKLNFNPTGMDVSSLYLDDGYLFFSVNPTELNVDNDTIDIEMRVYEGNQATIGEVRVFGNTKTSDHVIIRELYTLPGNKFSRSDLINSQQIIARLGYFDPEQISINPIPNMQDGTVDIEYTVVEKPSDQLQLSGGWGGGGRIGFVGTLGVVFNNFSMRNIAKFKQWDPLPSGDGQRFSIQAQANGKYFQNYSLSFTEPWLGGKKPNSFSVSLNHSLYGRYTTEDEGFMKISGASVSLGRRLRKIDQNMTLSNSLSYYHYNIDNYSWSGSNSLCTECQANNFNFNTTLGRSTTGPNMQFPTQGSDFSLSVSLTPPYSLINRDLENLSSPANFKLVEYNKWMFDYSSFLKISAKKRQEGFGLSTKKERPLVLHTRFHFGYIGSYNKNLPLSPFERFRMGGTGINGFNFILGTEIISLRGYTEDALYPDGVGGIIYDKAVFELRYPIVTEGVATIYGFGFFEAGNNWGKVKDFNPLDLKRSVGAGASLFMNGIGNISFGYGWGLDYTTPTFTGTNRTPTNGGQFLFSIGSTIR